MNKPTLDFTGCINLQQVTDSTIAGMGKSICVHAPEEAARIFKQDFKVTPMRNVIIEEFTYSVPDTTLRVELCVYSVKESENLNYYLYSFEVVEGVDNATETES